MEGERKDREAGKGRGENMGKGKIGRGENVRGR